MEYNSFFKNIKEPDNGDITAKNPLFKISQNGTKYRSICDNCNNNLLGAKYDHSLEALVRFINGLITSKIIVPSKFVMVKININKLARSIVGHILSSRNKYEEKITTDIELRKYFLDQSSLPPSRWKLLLRVYPYKRIVIARDLVVMNVLETEDELPSGLIDILSFYPIGFVLCSKGSNCGHIDIFSKCTTNIDDEIELFIDLSTYKHQNSEVARHYLWPVNISDDKYGTPMVLIGESVEDSIVTKKIQK